MSVCYGQIKDQAQTTESIDPLDASTHSDGNTVQIVSGRIATDPTMNVHEAVAIGTEMMKHYESTWPGGFHDTLPGKVLTMAITKKHGGISNGVRHQSDLFTHHWLESFRSEHEPQGGFEVRVSTYPYFHVHQQWRVVISDK